MRDREEVDSGEEEMRDREVIKKKKFSVKAATRSHLVSDDTPTSRVVNTKLLESEFLGTVHQRYIFTLNTTKFTLILINLAIKISLSVSVSLLALSTQYLGGHRS